MERWDGRWAPGPERRWPTCCPGASRTWRFRSSAASSAALAHQPPGVHAPLALDLDLAALLEHEFGLEQLGGALADLDAVGLAVRLHPRSGVDGVAPEVVGELVLAD